jgi:hypothetical protein
LRDPSRVIVVECPARFAARCCASVSWASFASSGRTATGRHREPSGGVAASGALSMALSPEARGGSGLVDVEVVGDDLHVQEPKDEQRESGHADECEHN